MGENKREYMPVRRYTFPAGVCGGEIRVTIPATASKADVIQMAKMLMVVAEDWSVGMQYYPDCVDWQK